MEFLFWVETVSITFLIHIKTSQISIIIILCCFIYRSVHIISVFILVIIFILKILLRIIVRLFTFISKLLSSSLHRNVRHAHFMHCREIQIHTWHFYAREVHAHRRQLSHFTSKLRKMRIDIHIIDSMRTETGWFRGRKKRVWKWIFHIKSTISIVMESMMVSMSFFMMMSSSKLMPKRSWSTWERKIVNFWEILILFVSVISWILSMVLWGFYWMIIFWIVFWLIVFLIVIVFRFLSLISWIVLNVILLISLRILLILILIRLFWMLGYLMLTSFSRNQSTSFVFGMFLWSDFLRN